MSILTAQVKLCTMNELPVIGSLCLRNDLWDRQGVNKLLEGNIWLVVSTSKKPILERDQAF